MAVGGADSLIGGLVERFAPGAGLLAVINAGLEIAAYWMSPLPLWFKRLATVVMGLVGLWCAVAIF